MSSRYYILEPEPEADERSEEEYVPIPDWHRKIIDERMAKYRTEGFEGTPWEEFEQELFEEIRKLTQK
jgi:putative addiction module component